MVQMTHGLARQLGTTFLPHDDLEVVWNGGPLLPDRCTKPDQTWTAPRRLYSRRATAEAQPPPDMEAVAESLTATDTDNEGTVQPPTNPLD